MERRERVEAVEDRGHDDHAGDEHPRPARRIASTPIAASGTRIASARGVKSSESVQAGTTWETANGCLRPDRESNRAA